MADYYAILKRGRRGCAYPDKGTTADDLRQGAQGAFGEASEYGSAIASCRYLQTTYGARRSRRAVERDLSGSGMSAAPAQQAADDGTSDFASGKNAGHLQERLRLRLFHRHKAPRGMKQVKRVKESAEPHKAVQTAKPQHKDRPDAKEPPRQEILEKKSPSDKVVRRAGQDVLKNAVRDANALGQATNKAVKHAQDAADAVGRERDSGEAARIEPTLGDAVVSQSKTYKRQALKRVCPSAPAMIPMMPRMKAPNRALADCHCHDDCCCRDW